MAWVIWTCLSGHVLLWQNPFLGAPIKVYVPVGTWAHDFSSPAHEFPSFVILAEWPRNLQAYFRWIMRYPSYMVCFFRPANAMLVYSYGTFLSVRLSVSVFFSQTTAGHQCPWISCFINAICHWNRMIQQLVKYWHFPSEIESFQRPSLPQRPNTPPPHCHYPWAHT